MAKFHRILIVEDDPIQQEILRDLFSNRGVQDLLIAENGTEAIAALKQAAGPIDLITCDLNMPECDGIEFLNHLRDQNSSTPVVIITSAHEFVSKSASILAKAHGLNILGTLRKPIAVWQLNKVLATGSDMALV